MTHESETIAALVVALHELIDNRQAAEDHISDLETDLGIVNSWIGISGPECFSPEMERAKRLLEKVTGKMFTYNGMAPSTLS